MQLHQAPHVALAPPELRQRWREDPAMYFEVVAAAVRAAFAPPRTGWKDEFWGTVNMLALSALIAGACTAGTLDQVAIELVQVAASTGKVKAAGTDLAGAAAAVTQHVRLLHSAFCEDLHPPCTLLFEAHGYLHDLKQLSSQDRSEVLNALYDQVWPFARVARMVVGYIAAMRSNPLYSFTSSGGAWVSKGQTVLKHLQHLMMVDEAPRAAMPLRPGAAFFFAYVNNVVLLQSWESVCHEGQALEHLCAAWQAWWTSAEYEAIVEQLRVLYCPGVGADEWGASMAHLVADVWQGFYNELELQSPTVPCAVPEEVPDVDLYVQSL